MSAVTLTDSRIQGGIWQGVVHMARPGGGAPSFAVTCEGKPLPGLSARPTGTPPDTWRVEVPVPAEVLCDGLQILLVWETGTAEPIGHFSIVTGAVVDRDLVTEIDLLRAELEMLRRAFRQHCLDTGC